MALRPAVSHRVPCFSREGNPFQRRSGLVVWAGISTGSGPQKIALLSHEGRRAPERGPARAGDIFGNPASSVSPVALRPRLTTGLPLSRSRKRATVTIIHIQAGFSRGRGPPCLPVGCPVSERRADLRPAVCALLSYPAVPVWGCPLSRSDSAVRADGIFGIRIQARTVAGMKTIPHATATNTHAATMSITW